jgi:hypothetical protein
MPNGILTVVMALIVLAAMAASRGRALDAAPPGGEALLLVRIDELTKTVDALTRRVAELERAPTRPTELAQSGQRVTAPFEVVDKSGKVILSVSDDRWVTILSSASKEIVSIGPDPKSKAAGMIRVVDEAGNALLDVGASARTVAVPFVATDKAGKPIMSVSDLPYDSDPRKGRVQVGRGNGDNYGIMLRRGDQSLAGTIGETKDGDGLVTVRDKAGKLRAELWAANGINLYDQSGTKQIASIAPNESGKSVRLKVSGSMQLRDDKDQLTFEAGENKQGGGLAHVFGKDGKIRAELDDDGIFLVSSAGKKVVSLGLNPASASGGVLDISGQLHMLDQSGATTVEMGTVGTGVGVVRVGPRYRCGPGAPMVAGIPSCMVGIR